MCFGWISVLAGRRVVMTPADTNMTFTVVAFAFLLYVLYSRNYSFKRCRYIIYLSLLTYYSCIDRSRSVRIAGNTIIIF